MTQQAVAIVTDSAAGLPGSLVETLRIGVACYWVHVGGRSYVDGVDLLPEAFYPMLRAQQTPDVSTGVPAPEMFTELYRQAAHWAKAVVSVHLAGKQSGTCDAARLGAQASPVPVTVIDTGTTAMAEGFVALEAARLAQAGASLEEVTARAQQTVANVSLMALLESVTFAVKGGRLAGAARLLGNLLQIQPLIRVEQNKLAVIGQVRRRHTGLRQLCVRIMERVGNAPVRLTVHYTEDEAEGQGVLDELTRRLHCIETFLTRTPVALGVHAGPGAIGVAYHIEKG